MQLGFSIYEPKIPPHQSILNDRILSLYFYKGLTHKPLTTFLFPQHIEKDVIHLEKEQHANLLRMVCFFIKYWEDFSGDFKYPVNITPGLNPQAVFMMYRGHQFNKNSQYGKKVHVLQSWLLRCIKIFMENADDELIPVEVITDLTGRNDVIAELLVTIDNGIKFTNIERVITTLFTENEINQLNDLVNGCQ